MRAPSGCPDDRPDDEMLREMIYVQCVRRLMSGHPHIMQPVVNQTLKQSHLLDIVYLAQCRLDLLRCHPASEFDTGSVTTTCTASADSCRKQPYCVLVRTHHTQSPPPHGSSSARTGEACVSAMSMFLMVCN